MAIKNYTSGVDIYTSLGEIQGALARAGATKIMVDYESGKPTAVTFAIETVAGTRGFRLPAAVDGTLRVFAAQKIKADRAQAERTAWRNIRDWVLAQLALGNAHRYISLLCLTHIKLKSTFLNVRHT